MKKILYFDIETTGTDPVKQDIIQIAGIIEIDGEITNQFNYKCQPFSYDNIQIQALEINKTTIEELRSYPKPKEVYERLLADLGSQCDKYDKNDKYYPAGYNVRFDLDFLANFFKKNGDNYFGSWQNWRYIDPLPIIYVLDYKGLLNLPNYKLETVCKHFDIKINAHDALSDIRATRELIKMLILKEDGLL